MGGVVASEGAEVEMNAPARPRSPGLLLKPALRIREGADKRAEPLNVKGRDEAARLPPSSSWEKAASAGTRTFIAHPESRSFHG